MDLRVTPQGSISRGIELAARNRARLSVLQEQLSTGKKLLRPSDDPLGIVTLLSNTAESQRFDAHLTNITDARTSLNRSTSALQDVGTILSTARQIGIEGAQSGNDASSYEALAQEVDDLISRLIDLGNSQQGGRYLFSGAATGDPPFRVASLNSDGKPQTVVYQGGTVPALEVVGPTRTMAILYPGDEVFQQRRRGTTTITGQTGAAAGLGTDSATAQGTLLVRHSVTTYAGGSGVSAGTSSGTGDTVIGPSGAHKLTITDTSGTGAGGTVSLDGGPQFSFTNLDTNLKISGPNGDVVYIDTTAITPGFNGDVAITANGTLSVDGGATQVAIDFSSNQVVTNSATGAVTNVNSSNIRRTGSDNVDYAGTYDAFQALIALRDDLRNTRHQSSAEQAASISRRVGELERAHTAILDAVGEQSVSLENLDALEQRIKDAKLENDKQSSELESVDLGQAVLELQSQESLLQLTYATAARVFDQNLLDFLK